MPSSSSIRRQQPAYRAALLPLRDFSGGLNLRDAATELSPSESPSMMNVSLDERGGVVKRLGMTKWNATPVAALITYFTYSQVADKILHYSKSDGKLYSDPGTGVLTERRAWTAGSRIRIVDFAGKVYAVHPVDGLYSSSDGVTWAAVVATSGSVPKGDVLASWQNKLWVSGDPANANRLYFCAAGDPTKWASADGGGSNDIREKDDSAIVAATGASGFDQQGKPSLVIGKSESLYRVYDSTTGAYVTLDASVGPASAKSLVSKYGAVYVLSRSGVYRTTGFTPCIPVSDKIAPQFTDQALNFALVENFCAGTQSDRLYFSVARNAASANDLAFEYHPLQGWFTARSDAAACYATYNKSADTLLGASPSVVGQVYKLNNGGSDDGTDIQSRWLSRVFEPSDGFQARLQQIRMLARGTFTLSVLPDFAAAGKQRAVSVVGAGFVWNTSHWDASSSVWGEVKPEDFDPWFIRQLGRSFQFRVDETSSLTGTGAKLLETGASITVGAWALYGLLCDFTPLGLS